MSALRLGKAVLNVRHKGAKQPWRTYPLLQTRPHPSACIGAGCLSSPLFTVPKTRPWGAFGVSLEVGDAAADLAEV